MIVFQVYLIGVALFFVIAYRMKLSDEKPLRSALFFAILWPVMAPAWGFLMVVEWAT